MSSSDPESGYESPEPNPYLERYNNSYKHPRLSDATSGGLIDDWGRQSVSYDRSTAVRADDPTLTKRRLQQVKESAIGTVLEKLNAMQALIQKYPVPDGTGNDTKVVVQRIGSSLGKALENAQSVSNKLQGQDDDVASNFLELLENTTYRVEDIHFHLKSIMDSELLVLPPEVLLELVELVHACRDIECDEQRHVSIIFCTS